MATPTIEDIKKEVAGNFMLRKAMNAAITKLRAAESDLGKELVRGIISGDRKLTAEEYGECLKKAGIGAISGIQAMENLTTAQKEYLFWRLDGND